MRKSFCTDFVFMALLACTLIACGNKGHLKTPDQIQADEAKKEKKQQEDAAKAAKDAAPADDATKPATPAQPPAVPDAVPAETK